jgi:uncharacterized protein
MNVFPVAFFVPPAGARYARVLSPERIFPYNILLVSLCGAEGGGMQMNVSQLLQEPIGATRRWQIDEAADITGDGARYPVRGECRLLRTLQGVLTSCEIDTGVELDCDRCNARYRQPLHLEFEEEFVPTIDVHSGETLPPPEEPGVFTIDDHHILDVSEAVRQYALTAIPLKALCSADCAGLCPSCGKNLNEGPCRCPAEPTDPRWAKLQGLF